MTSFMDRCDFQHYGLLKGIEGTLKVRIKIFVAEILPYLQRGAMQIQLCS